MPSSYKKETLYLDTIVFLLAGFAIGYLLVRHWLLVNKKLKPEETACGDCSKACLGVVSSPTLARVSTNELDSRDSTPSAHMKLTDRATFGCLLVYCVYCFTVVAIHVSKSILGLLPFHWCFSAVALSGALYLCAKSCMYLVFVGRLHQAFEGSSYAQSERTTNCLYATVCVYSVAAIAYWLAFARGKKIDTNEKGVNYCETAVSNVLLVFVMFFDMGFTVTVVFKFVNALRKMLRDFTARMDERRREEDITDNITLYLLPLKYTVLSAVAVFSTFFSILVFMASGFRWVFAIDAAVNCASLLFMTTFWEYSFEAICNPLMNCLVKTPFLPCAALTQPQLVELLEPAKARRRAHSVASAT